jgi:hypothetical protein
MNAVRWKQGGGGIHVPRIKEFANEIPKIFKNSANCYPPMKNGIEQ